MTDITKLSPQQCEELFTPVLGAYVSTLVPVGTIVPDIATKGEEFGVKLKPEQIAIIRRGISISSIFSLGSACFGFVFERYAKLAGSKDEAGRAFGFDRLAVKKNFMDSFPNNTIRKWDPSPNAGPAWFSSMIRNAFAHGQWETESGAQLKVILQNFAPQKGLTLDVTVTLEDLRRVLLAAILRFIRIVQQPATVWDPANNATPRSHEILYNLVDGELRNDGLGLRKLFSEQ